MANDIVGFFELGEDVLSEYLSELDTHLVERVDTPDDTLGEDLVLVERNEGTY